MSFMVGDSQISLKPRGHLIRVLNEGSIIDSGNLCPLWLVILKSV